MEKTVHIIHIITPCKRTWSSAFWSIRGPSESSYSFTSGIDGGNMLFEEEFGLTVMFGAAGVTVLFGFEVKFGVLEAFWLIGVPV